MSERPELLIARFGELWLKGANRGQFTHRLIRNLQGALKAAGLRGGELRIVDARIVYLPPAPGDVARAMEVFRATPGLANVSACVRAPKDLASLQRIGAELVRQTWTGPPGTWACRARRVDKAFPLNAPAIEQAVAAEAGLAIPDWKVDLMRPQRTLLIEILTDMACVSAWTEDCVGGLPVGTAGRVTLLLSGGLDSPVAGYLAQKRGCELDAVYFHSPPYIGEASREKVVALARNLAARQGGLRLFVVRFSEIQEAIHASCSPKLTVLMYRRFMYRIAARLARERGALALCTGENLGQVASQTLENLQAVERAADMLTLRPLVAYDKMETVAVALRIGTYETSILPGEDCCTLFVPRHPAVRVPAGILESEEAKLDVEGLVSRAMGATEAMIL